MSYDYGALRDGTVKRILTKYGVAATLTRWTKGAYDEGTASYGAGSTADLAVTVVITEYTEREIDGTSVLRTDKRAIMGGADPEPIANDKLKVGGVEYEIVAVSEVKPGNVVVAYDMTARK